jgi:hypothetical protein
MILKSLITTAAVAGTVLALAAPANAKSKVDVYVDFGGFGFHDAGYGHYDGHGYGHGGWRISCGEGKQKVRWAGFKKVHPVDCEGKYYRYQARKHGDWYVVTVRSKSGKISNVEPMY